MVVHSRSAFHPPLGRLRIDAPRLWPLSPELHTLDCSFACPGSSTWVDKVPSRGRVARLRYRSPAPSEPDMTIARHPAQASAVGKRSPAARSIRSWFRLTGGFRHPSFGLFSLRRLTSPSVEASSLIVPLTGSLRPFGLILPARPALSAPLQDGFRFLRHPLPPPPSPSLRSE